MATTPSVAVGLADMKVIAISPRERRVRDASRSAHDTGPLCGFVPRRGDLYEVLVMGDPLA